MERVKSRSESPFSQSKGKNNSSNISENGSRAHEQLKSKKKNQKNKNKHQAVGKENEDLGSNGQDYMEKDQAVSNEMDTNGDSNDVEHKNEVNGVNKFENERMLKQENETNSNENGSDIVYETKEEGTSDRDDCQPNEDENKESDSVKEDINVDENSSDKDSYKTIIETENSAKKEISLPECKVVIEAFDEMFKEGTQNFVKTETNGRTQDQEPTEECSLNKEVSEVGLDNSNDSLGYEKSDKAQHQIQASPDTATKDDYFLPNKITTFFGALINSTEQKQDSEISSSKKIENTVLNHPYLSKVSGRRGIKERLNSSATVFSSQEEEAKTPENMGISLDDSFRVRTNPSRLYSADLDENPTLRKFKGKRCLNAGDEPEETEDEYLSNIKRRKLDEKTQMSGILGSIMWSPFKNKSLENENQLKLSTTESKLSRLLSPFWFWKKTTESQKQK